MKTTQLTIVLLLMLGLSTPFTANAAGIQVDALAVTTTNLNLRAGSGTGAQILRSIPAGGYVFVRSGPYNSVWYAATFAGITGYVHSGYLTQRATPARLSEVITTGDIVVRAGPGTGNAVVVVAPRGARVTIGEAPVAGGWRKVVYSGFTGYAFSDAFTRTLGGGGAKHITVDLSDQWLYVYEGGQTVLTVPVSTGRDGFDTPRAVHRVQWKAALRTMNGSSNGETWSVPNVPHAMYLTSTGVALHGTYWHSLFGSGARLSHGCINLPMEAAALLYDWVSVGTTVEVRE